MLTVRCREGVQAQQSCPSRPLYTLVLFWCFLLAICSALPSGVRLPLHRMRLATTRAIRALEFNAWLERCNRQRSVMYILVNTVVCVTIFCLTYANLVFAARFDRDTCTDWLMTCVIALLVEATLQQPVVLLMTGVLGDFIEEGADFLIEVLDF